MSHNNSWYQLDNAAKMFPSTALGADTKVFRIACELNESILPEPLQTALEYTAAAFPHFGCILKRGLFWYYLEERDIRPQVSPDDLPPCSPLYVPGRKNLLYRVTYYRNRINLEAFHVLADGTGAFDFLRELLIQYLSLVHSLPLPAKDTSSASLTEKSSDAFDFFYDRKVTRDDIRDLTGKRAFQLHEAPDENYHCHLLEGTVSSAAFLEAAHKYDTTAGVLSCSLLIESILGQIRPSGRKHPVIVSIPVNLRKYFPSETARNFFGVINVAYDPAGSSGTLPDILETVRSSFEAQLTKESIEKSMNSYARLEHNPFIKIVPLFIKDPVVSYFYARGRKGVTCTISNLGRISVPAPYAQYIHHFVPFMTSASLTMCMCSFGDVLAMGTASGYRTNNTMLAFYRKLNELGISAEIASNDHEAAGPQGSGIPAENTKGEE